MKYLSITLLAWGLSSVCHAADSVVPAWDHVVQVGPAYADPTINDVDVFGDGHGGLVLEVDVTIVATATSSEFLLWIDRDGQEIWRSEVVENNGYLLHDLRPGRMLYRQSRVVDLGTYITAVHTPTGVLVSASILVAPQIDSGPVNRFPTRPFDPGGFFKLSGTASIARFDYLAQAPVLVAPSSFGTDGSNYIVSWTSISGRTYKVQSTPDLAAPAWTDRSNLLSGTGVTMSYAQPVTTGALYFRVIQD
jgi:hypothetical protein